MAHFGTGDRQRQVTLQPRSTEHDEQADDEQADDEHLGTRIPRAPGAASGPRIVMVCTSGVFADPGLVPAFWNRPAHSLDSGVQGHLYTRPGDVFVVHVPVTDAAGEPGEDTGAVTQLLATLDLNAALWARYTGLRLATSADRIVIAADRPPRAGTVLPPTVRWRVGGLLSAAATEFRSGRVDLLAGVLDRATLAALVLDRSDNPDLAHLDDLADLAERATVTSVLMNKNAAMSLLWRAEVACADTFAFTAASWAATTATATTATTSAPPGALPGPGRYVFKPAGGAAGVGVFGASAPGSTLPELVDHVTALASAGTLPQQFQLQRFLPGPTFGACAVLGPAGARVVEVHRQRFDEAGRFAGARWSAQICADHADTAAGIAAGIGRLPGLPVRGLICWDMIAGRVIEVNPRLTASSPIAHLLSREPQIAAHLGAGFRLRQIDLNTSVTVPTHWLTVPTRAGSGSASTGSGLPRERLIGLIGLIDALWHDRRVLALPQGLTARAPCRFVFVNDDEMGTAQRIFLAALATGAG